MPRRKRHHIQNRDRNRDLMRAAGQKARDEGRPLTACPSLLEQMRDDPTRALQLIETFADAWLERDKEIRQPWLLMKGAG